MIETVAVIGAGTIGSSWVSYFLSRGCKVKVWDPADSFEKRTRSFITSVWPILETIGLSKNADINQVLFCSYMEDALCGASFVQENAPEDAKIKSSLIADMDYLLPREIVISSSSTALTVTEFQGETNFPERVVLGHPFNPPHLMPLVEVGGGKKTANWAVDRAMEFYESVGKTPIRLKAEIPGHLANRLQAAVYREAVHLVAEGYATVSDIDKAMANGPGLRWSFMGPHMTYHLGGGAGGISQYFDSLGASQESRWSSLGKPKLTDEVKEKIIKGVRSEAAGRTIDELSKARDEVLVNILKAINKGSI